MSDPGILRGVLPEFLPGTLAIVRGNAADYRTLARFHYLAGPPGTRAAVWTVRYTPSDAGISSCPAAVAVLSWPTPCHRWRYKALGLTDFKYGERLTWGNANLRTISRVIVHPQFRALGLAGTLVRWTCANCDTRYVDATARMGRVHPFFERAGMTPIPVGPDDAAYYLLDRKADMRREAQRSETSSLRR